MTAVPPNKAVPPGEDPTVSAQLAQASARYEGLPAEVATRLDRVLEDLPPLEPPPSAAPVPARQPWWRRGWILAGATTGIAAVFAGGLFVAMSPTMLDAPPTDTGANAPQDSQEERGLPETDGDMAPEGMDETEDNTFGSDEAGFQVTYSGHDYSADGLTYALSAEAGAIEEIDPVLGPIASDQVKLDACAGGAQARFSGTVTAVDFGMFEGAPAVIVVVSDGDGQGTIVAQRPACADVGYDAYHAAPYGD